MKKLLLAFAGFVGALATAPAMAQTSVNCPLTTANRSISDTLPAGWTQVPYAQRLTNTRITESGVLQTLICEYGEAGNVQRAAPADTRCTARSGGFTCVGTVVTRQGSPNVITAPQTLVYRSGSITLERPTAGDPYLYLDFDDRGTQDVRSSAGAEIAGITHSDRGWRFDIGSGAKLWMPGATTQHGRATCVAAESSFQSSLYNPVLPAAGRYVCFKTSEGRFGEFLIAAHGATPGKIPTVTIQYWTW